MLNRLLAQLHAHGWFDTGRTFESSVHLTRGACLWLLLTRGGVAELHVKFSPTMDLSIEAGRCREASARYPRHAPHFVGHLAEPGLQAIACRAVEGGGVVPGDLRHARRARRLLAPLLDYFFAMPSVARAGPSPPLDAQAVAYFDAISLGPLARRWLDRLAPVAAELPALAQHGDLVANNLACTREGALVIYDWEDFGASTLAGLDLFTFELSIAGDVASLLAGRAHRADPLQRFIADACAAMGIDPRRHLELAPLHALAFRYLKRNFGPEVRERMDRVLVELTRALETPA